jgi:hypothetical protein
MTYRTIPSQRRYLTGSRNLGPRLKRTHRLTSKSVLVSPNADRLYGFRVDDCRLSGSANER